MRLLSDGSKQAITYSMPAGATQLVTLAPGSHVMNYVMAGGNGIAPRSNPRFVVNAGQMSCPGDWWFGETSAGYVNVLAPRKHNVHQHDLFAILTEVECDPGAGPAYRTLYPRLSQVLRSCTWVPGRARPEP